MDEADSHLRTIVFKACHLAVWTDRKMTVEEQRYLSHLVEGLGRTQAERKRLRELQLQEVDEGLLFSEIEPLSEVQKTYVFDTCLETLASDRRITARELRFLARLRKVCRIGYWSHRRRLSRIRRQAGARIYPWRKLAVVGFVLLMLIAVVRFRGCRSSHTEATLEAHCTGRDIAISLFRDGAATASPAATGEEVFAQVRDSIVSVQVLVDNDPVCSGSGAVIGTDPSNILYIVTNRHVIDGFYVAETGQPGDVRVEVKQYSGAKFDAVLDFASDEYDLAILAVRGMVAHSRPLPLHLKAGLQVGQEIYAIGSPLGLDHTFTAGVISAFRDIYLQTDATVFSGSSGGPLVDAHGALCAVVTRVHRTKDYGFALYSDILVQVLKEREEGLKNSS